MKSELDEFVRKIIENVRDRSIRNFDIYLSEGKASNPTSERYRNNISTSLDSAIENLIPDAVDEVIFNLLIAIENGIIKLKYTSESGSEIDVTDQSGFEMSGDYIGDDGYRDKFAKERYFQY